MKKIKLIHIAGPGRSGSTLIEKILGGIDGICSLGEVRLIWERGFIKNRLCSCGKRFYDCPFWQEIIQNVFYEIGQKELHEISEMFMSIAKYRSLPFLIQKYGSKKFKYKVKIYRKILKKLYNSAASVDNVEVLVESSKHIHGHFLAGIQGIELYVIHLTRDVRATSYSWSQKKVYDQIEGSIEYLPIYPLHIGATNWILENLSAEFLRIRCKEYIRIRYEDFTKDPENTIRNILTFTGIDLPNKRLFNKRKTILEKLHIVSGNPVRYKDGEISIINDERWNKKMRNSQKITMKTLTYPFMNRYEY